jgi:glutamine amidotransferase-like uncharacterized protein
MKKTSRIALVNPPVLKGVFHHPLLPPLGIAYLAAVLEARARAKEMSKKHTKLLLVVIVIAMLLIPSFLILIEQNAVKQNTVYVVYSRDTETTSVMSTFRFVNRLLLNNFKVYMVAEKTEINDRLPMLEVGDFVIPPQDDQQLLDKYVNRLSQELSVQMKKVNSNSKIEGFPLKEPKVAIYYGGGTTGGALEHLLPLEEADFEIGILNSSELEDQYLSNFNVITFPGGGPYENYLDEKTLSSVKDFVSNGGGFVGTCGGAALGIDMDLLPVQMMQGELYPQYSEYANIRGPLKIKIVSTSPLTAGYGDFLDCVYFMGPFFQKVGDNVDVVARLYSTTEDTQIYFPELIKAYNFSLNADSINRAWNTPAVISGKYGQGRVVLSSLHPEILPESQRFFINFVYFALSGEKETINGFTHVKTLDRKTLGNAYSNSVFNETAFLKVMSSIQKLSNDSNTAFDIAENFTEANYKIIGVTVDYLNMFLQDINTRSAKTLNNLETLKDKYGVLENISKNLKENAILPWVRIKLLTEANNLQNQISYIISFAYANDGIYGNMREICAEITNQRNAVEEITSYENSTLRSEKIIELYNSESSTLSKLKDNMDRFLLLLFSEIKSLLTRLDFFELMAQ